MAGTTDLANSTDNRGPILLWVTGAFLALSWFSVILRCYVRIWITNAFQADDWLMLASIAIFTVNGGFLVAGVHYGLGKHNLSLPLDERIQALKYQALATIMYIADMAFIKASIAVFLLRIAVRRRFKWILRISITIVVFWTIAIFLFNVFQCSPVAYQWDTTIEGGKCVSGDALVNAAYAFSVLAVLSDWLYALLPIPMLWSVKMNLQTKASVTLILSLGVLASIATLIRVKFLIDLANFDDILFTTTDAEIWTIIEPGLSITAASIVTLRPLLRAMKIAGFSSNGTYGSGYPSNGHIAYARPGPQGYMRSRELDELPLHGVRTVITRDDGTKGLSVPLPVKTAVSKSNQVLGRDDDVSDIGSEDFIIHSHSRSQTFAGGGIHRTNTVTVKRDLSPGLDVA